MPFFRKKPAIIEAVQLRWDNWSEMCEFAGVDKEGTGAPRGISKFAPDIAMLIPTLEGDMIANQNDWIIKGVKGELYPCKPDIFEITYEKVEVNNEQ